MKFNALMHVSFYTAKYDEMLDFYINKLGLKQHVLVRWKEYRGRTDKPQMAEKAETDPATVFLGLIFGQSFFFPNFIPPKSAAASAQLAHPMQSVSAVIPYGRRKHR